MSLFSGIVEIFTGPVKTWQEGRTRIKEAKIKAQIAKFDAQAKRASQQDANEASWDLEAQRQSQYSWKDEFIMVIWFTPFIMLFIPSLQPYAEAGFRALAKVPYGYWVVIFGIVASSFGLRWLFAKRVDKAIKSIKDNE